MYYSTVAKGKEKLSTVTITVTEKLGAFFDGYHGGRSPGIGLSSGRRHTELWLIFEIKHIFMFFFSLKCFDHKVPRLVSVKHPFGPSFPGCVQLLKPKCNVKVPIYLILV